MEASFVVARPKRDTIVVSRVSIMRLIRAIAASAILRTCRLAYPKHCEYRNGPPFARPLDQHGDEFLHAESIMRTLPMIL
jgi:hypothetical protein